MTTSDGVILGVTKIFGTAARDHAFTIVLMGDGFTSAQQIEFNSACTNFVNALFATVPFNGLSVGINVFRVNVASTDSGADDPIVADGGTGIFVNTYFDSTFGYSGIRRLLVCDQATALAVAAVQVPEFNVAVMIVNSTIYGGSGGSVTVYSLAASANEIALHEMGHAAFGLADEYAYLSSIDEIGHDQHPAVEPSESNVTINQNRNSLKWRWAVSSATSIPTMSNPDCSTVDQRPSTVAPGIVGLFEGAHYYHCGAFRPEHNCKMRTLSQPFCLICQDAITNHIIDLAGPFPAFSLPAVSNYIANHHGNITYILNKHRGTIVSETYSGPIYSDQLYELQVADVGPFVGEIVEPEDPYDLLNPGNYIVFKHDEASFEVTQTGIKIGSDIEDFATRQAALWFKTPINPKSDFSVKFELTKLNADSIGRDIVFYLPTNGDNTTGHATDMSAWADYDPTEANIRAHSSGHRLTMGNNKWQGISVVDPESFIHVYPSIFDTALPANIIVPTFAANGGNAYTLTAGKVYDFRTMVGTEHINSSSDTTFRFNNGPATTVVAGGKVHSTNNRYSGSASGASWVDIHDDPTYGSSANGNYASIRLFGNAAGFKVQGFYVKNSMGGFVPQPESPAARDWIFENCAFKEIRDACIQDDGQLSGTFRNCYLQGHSFCSWLPGGVTPAPKSGEILTFDYCLIDMDRQPYSVAENGSNAATGSKRSGKYVSPTNRNNTIISGIGVGMGHQHPLKSAQTGDAGGMKIRVKMSNCLIRITTSPVDGTDLLVFPKLADGVGVGSTHGSSYTNVHICWLGPPANGTGYGPWPWPQTKADLAALGITLHDDEAEAYALWSNAKTLWEEANGYDSSTDTYEWTRKEPVIGWTCPTPYMGPIRRVASNKRLIMSNEPGDAALGDIGDLSQLIGAVYTVGLNMGARKQDSGVSEIPFNHSQSGFDGHASACWDSFLARRASKGNARCVWYDVEDKIGSINVPASVGYTRTEYPNAVGCANTYLEGVRKPLRDEAVRFWQEIDKRMIAHAAADGFANFEIGSYNHPRGRAIGNNGSIDRDGAELNTPLLCPYEAWSGTNAYVGLPDPVGPKPYTNPWPLPVATYVNTAISSLVTQFKLRRAAIPRPQKLIPTTFNVWGREFLLTTQRDSEGYPGPGYPTGNSSILPAGAFLTLCTRLLDECDVDGIFIYISSGSRFTTAPALQHYEDLADLITARGNFVNPYA